MTTERNGKGLAVIAGTGEGLGLALGQRFAQAGYTAVLLARNKEKLDRLAGEIEKSGGKAIARTTDVRDEAQIMELFEELERDHGAIEVVIYNAGAQHRKPLLEITGDQFEKVWRLGCFGAFIVAREAVRYMVARGRGTVLFTGATASVRGGPNFSAFAAAKFGVRAIAQSIAREFGPKGIHSASVIVDGAIDMPAIRRMMPEMVANAPPDGLLATSAIAEAYYQLHCQHRSAWSHEIDVRPYSEKF